VTPEVSIQKDGAVSVTVPDTEEGGSVQLDVAEGVVSVTGPDGTKTEVVQDDQSHLKMTVDGEETTVELKDNGVVMTGPHGDMKLEAQEEGELVDSFPKEVPVYPGATITTSMSMTKDVDAVPQDFAVASFDTTDPFANVEAYYKEELPKLGWEAGAKTSQPESIPFRMLNYKKDGRELTVTMTARDNTVSVSIAVSAETKP